MKNNTKTIVLLDAHAILHRAYHGMPTFATSDGRPTGALYGFITMTLRIKETLKPDYVIACYDLPKPTFRHNAYKEYKAGRSKTDEALVSQIQVSMALCESLGIPVYASEGFEADDILGTIVKQTKDDKDIKIIIASGDMDTMQLIDKKKVQVFTLKKGTETVLYDTDAVFNRYGFNPAQIPDYKGLAGDPSDNIMGVEGIGAKGATTLIQKYGSIEKIYAALKNNKEKMKDEGIKERTLMLLEDGEEEAFFSKTLATISCDAPITFVMPEKKWEEGIDREKFKAMCDMYEFKSLKNKFDDFSHEKNDDRGEKEEEKKEESGENLRVTKREFVELQVLTNLIDSEITNPNIDTIFTFSNTKTVDETRLVLEKKIKEEGLFELYEKVERPLMACVEEMEEVGIKLDVAVLKKQSIALHEEVDALEKEIHTLAGHVFTVASPKQLGVVLYDELNLGEKIKKTKGGARSTNVTELEKIKDDHPIVPLIMEYRELSKIVSTYVDTLPTYVKEDGRIHAHFVQAGSGTGRFSCEDPNLQNLPIKSGRGRKIREAFVAEKGKLFLSLDYAQIDLRAAAILSQDKELLDIFYEGIDVHTGTAARMFSVQESEVTDDMRRKAKSINFGILYGMGVNALKEGMKVERKEAQLFYDTYRKTFSRLMGYMEEIKIDAWNNGYTKTILGRKRRVPLLKSALPFLRAQGERIAINAPMQGTSADILKLAILDVDEYLRDNTLKDKVKLIVQIHDELVYEVDEELVEKMKVNIREIMQNVLKKRHLSNVPLVISTGTGVNLYTL